LHQREKEGEEGIDEDRHSAMMVQQQVPEPDLESNFERKNKTGPRAG
jgi:hypothetical protein